MKFYAIYLPLLMIGPLVGLTHLVNYKSVELRKELYQLEQAYDLIREDAERYGEEETHRKSEE